MGGVTRSRTDAVCHAKMERAGPSRRNARETVHVNDSCGAEGIRCLSVDVGGEFDIVVEPERLQRNGVGFEVLKHTGDIIKPKMLNVAPSFIHCHT